jgi:hypothetical protein
MGRKIALGTATEETTAIIPEALSLIEEVEALKRQVEVLVDAFNAINRIRVKDDREEDLEEFHEYDDDMNKDGIPIGTILFGNSTRGGESALIVRESGYSVGGDFYETLSAAAEAVSGVRRSGWTFWKMPDGRNAKETFRRD